MAMYTKVGHFTSDGGEVNIPLGFIPDYIFLAEVSGGSTGTVMLHWFRQQQSAQASGTQEGFTVKEGVTGAMADDNGIIAYDSSGEAPTITTWTQAVSTAATARSATADGTFVKPSTSSTSAEREAVFECVTAGTGAATEPTWPKGIGEQVTDGTTVWERVREPRRRYGYKGFKFYGNEQTDSDEYYYFASKADEAVDHGDVDGWPSGVQGG